MSNDEQRKRVMEKARFWYGKSGWRSGEITQDQMDSFATLLAQEAEIEKLRDGEPTEFVLHQINEQLRQRVAELEAENARLNKIANPTYSAEKTREESAVRLRKIKELRAENEQLNNQHASDVNTIMEQEALLKAKEAIIKGTGGLHRVVKELTAENAELSKSVHVSIVEGENKKLRQRVAELEAELVENGTLVKTIRAERDQYKSLYADEQEVYRDEVDEALKGAGDGVEGNYGTVTVSLKQWREMNEEIARLREALEFVRYYDFKFMVEYIDEALAGAKGAEGGAETNDGEANAAEDSVGGSTGGTRPSKTEAEAGDHVGDDRVERSADNDSPTGPTPLSEPLCVTAPESTDAGCIRACMRMNKERIEQRYAEVVAAIAELRQEVERCKNRYDKLIPREFAETNRDRIAKMKENHQNKLDKMQEQIDSLSSRCRLLENEDQNQHDSLTDQGHAIDEHRLKIEALKKKVEQQTQGGGKR